MTKDEDFMLNIKRSIAMNLVNLLLLDLILYLTFSNILIVKFIEKDLQITIDSFRFGLC